MCGRARTSACGFSISFLRAGHSYLLDKNPFSARTRCIVTNCGYRSEIGLFERIRYDKFFSGREIFFANIRDVISDRRASETEPEIDFPCEDSMVTRPRFVTDNSSARLTITPTAVNQSLEYIRLSRFNDRSFPPAFGETRGRVGREREKTRKVGSPDDPVTS